MGLLNPGERLPPESVIAEHLGVSPLTLRQSLAVLRSKRLLGTRRGRGGGSYVAGVLPVREAEIAQQLRRHKSDDLRDLIDLAAATAGSAARLASKRSDEQDVRRLRKLAQRFASSSEPHMCTRHSWTPSRRGARRSREHRNRTLRTGRCPDQQPAPGHPHLGPGGQR
ncbi:GntR family transcriptional regulator [Arthrobacter globiformis]|uniref:HTH gntR-type domain-containing protein n=1 Tax=Arthrobacter globiformis TaxID=1665 RepID=A0A328HII0_ARTGO|nr:hypothetical protein DBZ45_12305 [Arthrobacter globiformis]